MSVSSITIKLDFGADGAAGVRSSVSGSGELPTPQGGGALSAAGHAGQAAPTPHDHAQSGSGRQAPSPSGTPASAGHAAHEDAPSPPRLGAASSTAGGAPAAPTPMDRMGNAGMGATGGEPPTPQLEPATGKKRKG